MRDWILAIDFGTSYTTAAAREGDHAEIIEIDGDRRVPSVIMVDDDGHLVVGRAADNQAAAHPGRVVREPKRLIGEPAPVVLGGRPYRITSLVGALLEYVYDRAVEYGGSAPTEVRLTHPATWRRPRLRALGDAAREAGIPSPIFVPEPVAAAIAYTADSSPLAGHVAIYDLGGGTFDTAVLQVREHGFVVEGRPGGDGRLGGEFFDELLGNHLGARLPVADWEALQVSEDLAWRQARAGYRDEVRKAKEGLSLQRQADLIIGLPTGLQRLTVTRDEFETLVRPHLTEANDLLATTIADASITPSDLTAIFMVGGASRIPLAEGLIRAAFPGVPVSRRGDPKMVVALGATHPDAAGASGEPVPAPTVGATLVDAGPTVVAGAAIAADTTIAPAAPLLATGPDATMAAGTVAGSTVVAAAETVLDVPGSAPPAGDAPPTIIEPPPGDATTVHTPGDPGRIDGRALTAGYPEPDGRRRSAGRPLAIVAIGALVILLAGGGLTLAGAFGGHPASPTPPLTGDIATTTASPSPSVSVFESPSPSPSPSASPSPSPSPSRIAPDTAGPTGGGLSIEGNISHSLTTTTGVTVSISPRPSDPSGVAYYSVSSSPTRPALRNSFAATFKWTLKAGAAGIRTVYVWFEDSRGNWSKPIHTTIDFDNPPTATGSDYDYENDANVCSLIKNTGGLDLTLIGKTPTVVKDLDGSSTLHLTKVWDSGHTYTLVNNDTFEAFFSPSSNFGLGVFTYSFTLEDTSHVELSGSFTLTIGPCP